MGIWSKHPLGCDSSYDIIEEVLRRYKDVKKLDHYVFLNSKLDIDTLLDIIDFNDREEAYIMTIALLVNGNLLDYPLSDEMKDKLYTSLDISKLEEGTVNCSEDLTINDFLRTNFTKLLNKKDYNELNGRVDLTYIFDYYL